MLSWRNGCYCTNQWRYGDTLQRKRSSAVINQPGIVIVISYSHFLTTRNQQPAYVQVFLDAIPDGKIAAMSYTIKGFVMVFQNIEKKHENEPWHHISVEMCPEVMFQKIVFQKVTTFFIYCSLTRK